MFSLIVKSMLQVLILVLLPLQAMGELNLEIPQSFLNEFHQERKKFNDFDRDRGSLVFGIDRETALQLSGVKGELREYDEVCGVDHIHGDVANNWCHAFFSKLVHRILRSYGYSEQIAQLGGVSVFLIKEFGDKNYNWGDITTAPIGGRLSDSSEAYVTLLLDGSFYIEYYKNF